MNSVFKMNTRKTKRTLVIDAFGGVDFLSHADKVDAKRSPDAKNMLCSGTGFLVKRDGYKRLFDLHAKVYGIHRIMTEEAGEKLLAHAGMNLYLISEGQEPVLLGSDMAQAYSSSFIFGDKLYILDGQNIRVTDGENVKNLRDECYVPLTTRYKDNGISAGETVEAPNMLTPRRRNQFIGTGSQGFSLDCRGIDELPVTVRINGAAYGNFSVNYTEGVIMLDPDYPSREDSPLVEITFSKTVFGAESEIYGCTIVHVYGEGGDMRVFLSGNPKCKNADFMSAPLEHTYFPVGCKYSVGGEASAILGYLSTDDGQLILKHDNGQDPCKYLRTFEKDSEGVSYCAVTQAGKSGGLLSKRSLAEVSGMRLYLSDFGVLRLGKTQTSGYDNLKCVSDRVNPRLLKEEGLSDALAVSWKNRYYIFSNSRAYVADCAAIGSDGQPEWYYFDNLPVSAALTSGAIMYLGMDDGRFCRFTDEDDGAERYMDDDEPVRAYWSTPVLNLGGYDHYKWLYAFSTVLMPELRSGVELYYGTERNSGSLIKRENADLFSFDDIDFSRFTFRTIKAAVPANGRIKRKCFVFQGTAQNNEPEPLGILAFTVGYKTAQEVR